MCVFLTRLTLVRNLTLHHGPVCHSSSGLYSEQDQISVALTQNGCEAAGSRDCTHGADICTSITRYEISLFCGLMFSLFSLFAVFFSAVSVKIKCIAKVIRGCLIIIWMQTRIDYMSVEFCFLENAMILMHQLCMSDRLKITQMSFAVKIMLTLFSLNINFRKKDAVWS